MCRFSLLRARPFTTGCTKTPAPWSPSEMQSPFKSTRTIGLLRSLIVYRICSLQWLARATPRLLGLLRQIHAERLAHWILRNTIYAQFCGGETIHDTRRLVGELGSKKIGVILDYAAEPDLSPSRSGFVVSEDGLHDQIKLNVLEAIEVARQVPTSMVAVKLSGLFDTSLLRLLNAAYPPRDINKFDIEATLGWRHLNQICAAARSKGIQIAIDAEQSFIQNAIDIISWQLMEKYNRTCDSSKPLIINTYQMYRKDALSRLQRDISQAERTDCHFGAKVVRGAYVVGESRWALEGHYECPIFGTIEETHASYNDAIRLIFQFAESLSSVPENPRRFTFVFATHNIDSLQLAAEYCAKGNFPTNMVNIIFAQLFGMSDTASLSMAKAGYTVYKYLPFGPVDAVVPYLIRRSEENSAIFKTAGSDAQMIWKELKSRVTPGVLWRTS